MGWRRNLKKRRRAGYAATGELVPRAYNAPGRKRGTRRPVQGRIDAPPEAATVQDATQPRPGDQESNPGAGPAGQPIAPGTTGTSVLAQPPTGDGQQPRQVALFESRPDVTKDARLARMAIKRSWEPQPEATAAVLTKATVMALKEDAKVEHVVAIAKLHLDAHAKVMTEEHHNDRLEYYERALEARMSGALPAGGTGIKMETDGSGKASVMVYRPNNARDGLDDELRPEDLLDRP